MKLENGLKTKIDTLWDSFWAGGISNPLNAIDQMSYLIFMNRLEYMDNMEARAAKEAGREYTSVFEGHEECRWSYFKQMPANDMLDHVRDVVFPFIKTIHNGEKSAFAQQMQDAIFIIPKASLLAEAVDIIDGLNIGVQNYDTLGDLYEYLLSQLQTAGKNGQFRTPRHIIRMMVQLVDPDINDRIADPACGTAGFLVEAYQHILAKHTSAGSLSIDEDGEYHGWFGDKITDERTWEKLDRDTVTGFDFDSTMTRISAMNLALHGIKAPNIQQMDTLSKRYKEEGQYSVILANPPFKGSIDKGDLNGSFVLSTTKTELLFIELMMRMLNMGGRCAVIVPDGVTFGNSNAHKGLRKMLMEQCQLEAVIAMPSGVFRPYAGVSTAILVFTKGSKTDRVWFYGMESDGYTLDDRRNPIDKKGDIPNIVERFHKRTEENPIDRTGKCFFVPIKEIEENNYDLSISRYKEIKHESAKFEKSEVIIERIETLDAGIRDDFVKLKELLKME